MEWYQVPLIYFFNLTNIQIWVVVVAAPVKTALREDVKAMEVAPAAVVTE